MGGLAPGKLKSRRGGQVLSEAPSLIDSGVGRDSRTHWWEKLYQLFRDWRLLIAIGLRRPGSFWSAEVAHSFAASGIPRSAACSGLKMPRSGFLVDGNNMPAKE